MLSEAEQRTIEVSWQNVSLSTSTVEARHECCERMWKIDAVVTAGASTVNEVY